MDALFSKIILLKFIKFGVVEFSRMIVDFGITFLCKEKQKISKYISNVLDFIVTAKTNWPLNRIRTFAYNNPQTLTEHLRFFDVSIIVFGITPPLF